MQLSLRNSISTLAIMIIIISIGCTATRQTAPADDQEKTLAADTADTDLDRNDNEALQTLLANNRSSLRDIHTTQKHDMPDSFMKKDSSDQSLNSNPFDGFRIQITSTRNKQMADTVAQKFRVWSDTTLAGYTAKAYVFFRQPYYKVHVGDFQDRDEANSFSKLIKRQYPDAWVVHDRINPTNVPADTASFSIKKDSTQTDR